jgi:hypothetical protein
VQAKNLIVIVVALMINGSPIKVIVQAFGLDERTVVKWRDQAGRHCQQVRLAVVRQEQLDLLQVQADKIRMKGHKMIAGWAWR